MLLVTNIDVILVTLFDGYGSPMGVSVNPCLFLFNLNMINMLPIIA